MLNFSVCLTWKFVIPFIFVKYLKYILLGVIDENLNISTLPYRDEDMQSMASLMSVNNNSDIAPLDDFDNEDIPEDVEEVSVKNLDEILDISAQLDLMTSSLTESELPSTPISGEC